MLALFRFRLGQACLCLILVLGGHAPWALAQNGSGGSKPIPPGLMGSIGNSPFDEREVTLRHLGDLPQKKTEESTCFLPPLDGVRDPTVGMAALKVQGKASTEYEKACNALREKKFEQAEKTLRKAIGKYPSYSDLWVLLAQALERRQQLQEATEACLRPLKTDAGYVPAYLCLADIAARGGDWNEVLEQSEKALVLAPSGNRVIYLYNGTAKFHLHMLKEAEDCALAGLVVDKAHPDPRMYYLLAQIYEAKGDRAKEEIQLRLCLKFSTDAKHAETIKQYLSNLTNTPADGRGVTSGENAAK
jgi:hypothetical protein